MLLIGQKYKFTKLEIERLNKKFDSITTIVYEDKNPTEVINQIENSIQNTQFTIIVLNTKAKVDDEIIRYLTNLKFKTNKKKFQIITIEHFLEKYLHKCYIPEDNNDLHYLDDIKGFSSFQKFQKKIIDIIAIFILLLIFPFIRYITKKKIKEQSPGSLYYKQLRVGLDNKEFECIKFRTMHENAEKDGVSFAKEGDSRIFPWGAIMRKTRLDEIPQVFNILKGEMSLIGPRAEWNKLVQEYEKQIPYYNQRHIVKPGITGWAQVMFVDGRNKEDTKQKLMYDLYYIKYWNLWLEIKIIFKTIAVVVGKKGV